MVQTAIGFLATQERLTEISALEQPPLCEIVPTGGDRTARGEPYVIVIQASDRETLRQLAEPFRALADQWGEADRGDQ